MPTLGELKLKLSADTSDLHKGTESAKSDLESMNKKAEESKGFFGQLGESFKGFLEVTGAVEIVNKGFELLTEGIKQSVEAATEAETTHARLNAILKATHDTSGLTADSAERMAEAFSKVTTNSVETNLSAETILASFTSIKKNAFEPTMQATEDLAAGMGISLPQAATTLGRAMDDPSKAMGVLRRAHIDLTAAQEKAIKNFIKVGDTAGAQNIILSAVEGHFKGAASAVGDTFAGKLQILQNQLELAKEKIGEALIPVLSKLMTAMTPVINAMADALPIALDLVVRGIEILSPLFDHLGPAIQTVVGLFKSQMPEAASDVTKAFSNITNSPLLATIEIMTTNIQEILNPVLHNMASIWDKEVWPAIVKVMPIFQQLGNVFANQFLPEIAFLVGAFMEVQAVIVAKVLPAIERLMPTIIQIAGWIGTGLTNAMKFLSPFIDKAAYAVDQFAVDLGQRLGPALNNIVNFIKVAMGIIETVWNAAWPYMSQVLMGVWNVIKGVIEIAWSIVSGIIKVGLDILGGNWKQAWNDIKNMFAGVWDGIKSILGGALGIVIGVLRGAWAAISGAATAAWNGIRDFFSNIWNNITHNTQAAVNNVHDWLSGRWNDVKSMFSNVGNNIHDAILKPFNDAKNALPGIWNGMQGAAKSGIKGIFGAISGFGDGFATAVDWVADRLGVPEPMDKHWKLSVPGFAGGVNNFQGGPAIVGEQGPELMFVPRGASIMPNKETMSLLSSGLGFFRGVPGFAGGLGDWLGGLGNAIGGGLSNLGNLKNSFFDLLGKGPGNVMDAIIKAMGIHIGLPTGLGNIATGMLAKVKAMAISWLNGAGMGSGGGSYLGPGGMKNAANMSEFFGFNGDCGETAELLALHVLKGIPLSGSYLDMIVHRDQGLGWAGGNGYITCGGIMSDLGRFYGIPTQYSNSWSDVAAKYAGNLPVIFLYSNAGGGLPGDERNVQWHFNTLLGKAGPGRYLFGDGDNRSAPSGRLNLYTEGNLAAARPYATIVVGTGSKKMANGGVIGEHIVGVGASGQTYEFGENGPETVVPGAGGDIVIHNHVFLDGNQVGQAIVNRIRLKTGAKF